MTRSHRPDPQFETHMEWQLRSAYRREGRFSTPIKTQRKVPLKAAILVLVSASLGAGGVVVKDEVQELRHKLPPELLQELGEMKLLHLNIAFDENLAQNELNLAKDRLTRAEALFREGSIREAALNAARAAAAAAELQLAVLVLDRKELEGSRKEPNDRLSAPLVQGQDYVTDRLALEKSFVMAKLEVAEAEVVRILELWEAGLVNDTEKDLAILAVRDVESERDRIERRMDVRRRFLAEGMEGSDPERVLEILETESRIQEAEGALVEALTHFEELEAALVPPSELLASDQVRSEVQVLVERIDASIDAGLIGPSELSKFRRARTELRHLDIELIVLKRKLANLKEGPGLGARIFNGEGTPTSSSQKLPRTGSSPDSP